ncbi:hypothetical protein [Bifidobacterium callitrichos]|uniref:Uncharacterized protein n=1 Tax=Bifidobacterium callitrichos DSM 23973 TaxID=1437609 RepID=A0A087A907_9BIFI|nr:hypothetical protein [Bifidobacterium callitrichos]KFI55257.1 hypothetical protein BCAL_1273 [Bifidobacterium callitrichos DSM 23973]
MSIITTAFRYRVVATDATGNTRAAIYHTNNLREAKAIAANYTAAHAPDGSAHAEPNPEHGNGRTRKPHTRPTGEATR